ncbi:MAG: ATP-binding protein [Planctomycetota bacterium]
MTEQRVNAAEAFETRRAEVWRVAGLGVLYLAVLWVGVWLGYAVQVGEEELTLVWLPTGVTFAALLLTRRRWWPALLLGSAAVFVGYGMLTDQLGVSFWGYVFFALVGDAVMWLGAEVFWLGRGRTVRLKSPGDLGWLFAVVLGVTSVGALASVSVWSLSEPSLDYWAQVQLWWFSDTLGCVVVVPWMLAVFGGAEPAALSARRRLEAGLLIALLLVICLVLVQLPYRAQSVLELPYLVLPLLIWGALRFGRRLATTLLLLLTLMFVLQVKQGVGPFVPNGRLASEDFFRSATLTMQVYLLVTCLAVLILSSLASRDRAARALQKMQSTRFDTMMRTLRTTLWVMDAKTDEITFVNPEIEELTGRSVEDMSNRPGAWRELVHPDDVAVYDDSLERIRRGEEHDAEYRIVRADGQERWVRTLLSAEADAPDAAILAVVHAEDVTHRHRASEQRRVLLEEIEASNARYQDFMRVTGEAVWRAEFDFPVRLDQPYDGFEDDACNSAWIAECNTEFAEMFGASKPEEIIGRRVTEFFPLRDRSNRVYRDFYEQRCRSITAEVCDARDPENPRWYRVSFAGVIENGCIVRIWGTRFETTAQRKLETQLRESQKREAIGQLAGGVAHDFNNLLAVISAHAELVDERVGEVEGVAKSLGVVREAIDHAADVSRSLMAFSKNLPGDKKSTDLRAVIVQTQRLLEPTLAAAVELEIEVSDENLWPVNGDAVQLQQVLLNLAINARDALPETGGAIWITATNTEFRSGDNTRNIPGVRLSVKDNGSGMPEEVRQRVFDPFFTTKGPEAGTGLGLSVVRGIVEEHGGQITVSSRPGEGATFDVLLPALEQAAVLEAVEPSGDQPASQLADQPGRGQTVLLGEDDAQIRAVIATALVGRGFEVIQAGDGVELRRAYDEHQQTGTSFAALVTDADMPGQSGVEVLRELRREGCDVPAVVISGSVDLVLIPETDGNTVLMHKPFGLEDFCRVVEERVGNGMA